MRTVARVCIMKKRGLVMRGPGSDAESAAVTEALLSMRRLDLNALEAAKRAARDTME